MKCTWKRFIKETFQAEDTGMASHAIPRVWNISKCYSFFKDQLGVLD